ncbi:DNA replication ATP-dependent helicase/nuclease DNA2, partial [Dictyocoela roeselum]
DNHYKNYKDNHYKDYKDNHYKDYKDNHDKDYKDNHYKDNKDKHKCDYENNDKEKNGKQITDNEKYNHGNNNFENKGNANTIKKTTMNSKNDNNSNIFHNFKCIEDDKYQIWLFDDWKEIEFEIGMEVKVFPCICCDGMKEGIFVQEIDNLFLENNDLHKNMHEGIGDLRKKFVNDSTNRRKIKRIVVSRKANMIIITDQLLPITNLTTALNCVYNPILNNLIQPLSFELNFPALIGTLIHRVVEKCMNNDNYSFDFIVSNIKNEIYKSAKPADDFKLNNNGSLIYDKSLILNKSLEFIRGIKNLSNYKFSTISTEKKFISRMFNIKGNVDAIVADKLKSKIQTFNFNRSDNTDTNINPAQMPLEIKTGKIHESHLAQVIYYLMMLIEKSEPTHGYLYYVKDQMMKKICPRHSDFMFLIVLRNRVAVVNRNKYQEFLIPHKNTIKNNNECIGDDLAVELDNDYLEDDFDTDDLKDKFDDILEDDSINRDLNDSQNMDFQDFNSDDVEMCSVENKNKILNNYCNENQSISNENQSICNENQSICNENQSICNENQSICNENQSIYNDNLENQSISNDNIENNTFLKQCSCTNQNTICKFLKNLQNTTPLSTFLRNQWNSLLKEEMLEKNTLYDDFTFYKQENYYLVVESNYEHELEYVDLYVDGVKMCSGIVVNIESISDNKRNNTIKRNKDKNNTNNNNKNN